MAAPKGNKFWEARASNGPSPKYKTGQELWDACLEYFAYVEANPLKSVELVKYQGSAHEVELPKMRAMTIMGLSRFLKINRDTWYDWKETRDDLSDIIACVAVSYTHLTLPTKA